MNRDGLEEEKFCEDNENCIEFLKGKCFLSFGMERMETSSKTFSAMWWGD
jgi:hypothetical protein